MQCLLKNVAFLCSIFAICLLSGCKTLDLGKKDKTSTEPVAEPQAMMLPVGTVHHVDPDAGFILVQSRRALDIEPETEIQIFNRSGVLSATAKVSPARKGQFLTADLVQGMPVKGDQALMRVKTPELKMSAGPVDPFASSDSDIQVLE